MIRPVSDPVGQGFGANPTRDNPHPVFGDYQPDGHSGQDYKCWAGTPIRAVASGTVLHIGRMGGTYADNPWWIQPDFAGYVAVIDHGAFIGIYGHCMDGSAKVRKGDRVTEGQVFVLSGNTGASTGDHLHFETLPDGYVLGSYMYGRINPELLFAPVNTVTPQSATITPTGTTTSQEDDMFTDADRENLEKSVNQQAMILGMLNNMAGWMNESGNETRDNVRKVTLETVYGQDAK